jgi:hypothetical protein
MRCTSCGYERSQAEDAACGLCRAPLGPARASEAAASPRAPAAQAGSLPSGKRARAADLGPLIATYARNPI